MGDVNPEGHWKQVMLVPGSEIPGEALFLEPLVAPGALCSGGQTGSTVGWGAQPQTKKTFL